MMYLYDARRKDKASKHWGDSIPLIFRSQICFREFSGPAAGKDAVVLSSAQLPQFGAGPEAAGENGKKRDPSLRSG